MIAANNGRRGVFGVDLVAVAFHSEHGQGAKLSLWCCMVSRTVALSQIVRSPVAVWPGNQMEILLAWFGRRVSVHGHCALCRPRSILVLGAWRQYTGSRIVHCIGTSELVG